MLEYYIIYHEIKKNFNAFFIVNKQPNNIKFTNYFFIFKKINKLIKNENYLFTVLYSFYLNYICSLKSIKSSNQLKKIKIR